MAALTPLTGTRQEAFRPDLPGSKSYTNRALVLAAQRPGTTRVERGLDCEDTRILARALGSFGGLAVSADARGFTLTRTRERLLAPRGELALGEAGTPARFVLAFAAAAEGPTVIGGGPRLCERPMADLLGALAALGIRHDALGRPGHLPVRIHPAPISSREWRVPAGVSSQYTSALCLLAAQQPAGPIRILPEGRAVSTPYVEMTIAMLAAQGIRAAREAGGAICVHPARPAHALIPVEVDASALSYFLAAAAVSGTTVEAHGIGAGSLQGDLALAGAFERMGCRVVLERDSVTLGGAPLRGIEIDMGGMPDAALTLAAAAALASGPTRITNVAHLRLKECDRITAARLALERLGVRAEEGPDWLAVHPRGGLRPSVIRTHADHRVAMAFAVLSLVAPGIEIDSPGCVAKSFPGFWQELERFKRHHRGR